MLNQAKLDAAAKSFRATFFQALEKDAASYAGLLGQLAMFVESNSDIEVHDWLGDIPGMELWDSDRKIARLRADGFELKNYQWSNGVAVKRRTIELDKLGLIMPRIRQLAVESVKHRYDQVLALMTGAATGVCYDGSYFVAADHASALSGTQSNIDTDLLDAAALAEGIATMAQYKNDRGKYMGIRPTHLLVCPTLEQTGRELVQAAANAAGATNVWAGALQLVVMPGLDGGGNTALKAWALADLGKAVKPFIDQVAEPVSFTEVTAPDSPSVFHRDEFMFGAQYTGNTGYGFWQLFRMSDGSGT